MLILLFGLFRYKLHMPARLLLYRVKRKLYFWAYDSSVCLYVATMLRYCSDMEMRERTNN